ncbi:hypothetical protein [Borrelia persica]|uniref:hypothetical protein n=1 Tax=Borrelia persica TaxID=44448 RepID=UPI000464617D|nr:hypothetical protein [Borrelia persica]
MRDIRSIIFKIYVFMLACFFVFFFVVFVIFVKSKFLIVDLNRNSSRYHYGSGHDDMVQRFSYYEDFNLSGIRIILFEVSYLNKRSDAFKSLQNEEREKIMAVCPSFKLTFTVSDGGRLMNFKNVIFHGVEANIYSSDLPNINFRSSSEPYFKLNKVNNLEREIMGEYPVVVRNSFSILINEVLFRILREQPKLKITVVAHDDVEYTVETFNFLSNERFNILDEK